MTRDNSQLSTSRLPSLDGWRAVSIATVLIGHSVFKEGFPASLIPVVNSTLSGGDIGVRCFFVISGLLITWLLVREKDETDQVSLRHFYIRRCLRILPVYFAVLLVVGLLQWATPYWQSPRAWAANLTFTTDFFTEPEALLTGHLWSLGVEEQFYFLWPALFLLCGGATNVRKILIVLSVPILTAPLFRIVSYKQLYPEALARLFGHYSFFNYFDSLAIGCLCAVLLARKQDWLRVCLADRPGRAAAAAWVLLLAPYGLNLLPGIPGRLRVASDNSLQAAGMGLLLMQSVLLPRWGAYRLLNARLVAYVGVLSYSIYLWQGIFYESAAYGVNHAWWVAFPGWILPTLVVAQISYFCLERPLFRLRSYFRQSAPEPPTGQTSAKAGETGLILPT